MGPFSRKFAGRLSRCSCPLRRPVVATGYAATVRFLSSEAGSTSRPRPYIQGDETHFGFESVGIHEKEGRVREVFESVADSYDVMNDLMSGGIHRYWKDYLLDISAVASMAKAVRRFPGNELRILDGKRRKVKTLECST